MRFIADLHIHSHYSRATSRNLNPENLSVWAQKKGIEVIGTGDFTHPGWIAELREKLVPEETGLFKLKADLQKEVDSIVPASCLNPPSFLLSGEISCIYKKNGKTRKSHHLILMPDMDSVLKFNERLDRIGNISSDGRPILGIDSRDLLEITLEVSDRAFFIPAHVWTPWFSVFGSRSGFDTLEECFEDLTEHIYALETGLSSDPYMNRYLSCLDKYLLVSNSDAHSPGKLGREANIFDTELEYDRIIQAMTNGQGFIGTIEFFPEEGKYHLDGHRKCQVKLQPAETHRHQGICPVCGKPLTIGVLNRIFELADREKPILSKDFISLIPLPEVLSELMDCGPATKKVISSYEALLSGLGPELKILMDTPLEDIAAEAGPLLSEAIDRMREKKVFCEEGYDGEYGVIRLFEKSEKQAILGQMHMFTPEKINSPEKDIITPLKSILPEKEMPLKAITRVSQKNTVLSPLNKEQRSAVTYRGGHLLVAAGPGTGKTMTLAHRIAYLIKSGIASPDQVLALTFTRKAAGEMKERISALLEHHPHSSLFISTFHGFYLELLRCEVNKTGLPADFSICSEMDVEDISKEILIDSNAGKRMTAKFLNALPDIKVASVSGYSANSFDKGLLSAFENYQSRLRDLKMLDMDDLEVETLRLIRNHPDVSTSYGDKYPWIFVDEYQDTNSIQVEILKTLIQAGKANIFAIGDPDQAIYGFRGAEVKNFHQFCSDFPGAQEIFLKRNYRSSKPILEISASLMGKESPQQCESALTDPIDVSPCKTDSEEAEMVVEQIERLIGGTGYFSLDSGRVASHEGTDHLGFGDIGILFRINAQGNALEKALKRAGIPFMRSGKDPLVSQYPINILWRFFQILKQPDNPYYLKVYEDLKEKHGVKAMGPAESFESPKSVSKLVGQALKFHVFGGLTDESTRALHRLSQIAADFNGNISSFLDAFSLERGIDNTSLFGDRVALMSIHAAKGLEWPVVFITGCEDGLIPCTLFGNADDEEERRLFYVGMTRARSRLILSHAKRRVLNGRVLQMKPSPFLEEMPKEILTTLDRGGWKPRAKSHTQLDLFSGS
jgi:DNA helicase-2/ATP-dependent DNA helicase PcrA